MKGGGNMDAGQITQGLRADAFQQGGQGANFMQLMESGVSFADIMRLITGSNQDVQGIMPNISDMSAVSQMSVPENELNILDNMQELIGLSAFQNMANVSDIQELENLLSSANLESVKNNGDNQSSEVENTFVAKSDLSEVGNIYQLANNLNKADIEKFIESLKNPENLDVENSDEIPVFKDQSGSKLLNVVQNPDNVQESEETPISDEVQKDDNYQNGEQNFTDRPNVKNPNEFQGSGSTLNISNIQLPNENSKDTAVENSHKVSESSKPEVLEITNSKIPKDENHIKDTFNGQNLEPEKNSLNGQNIDQIKNILDGQNVEQIKNILNGQSDDQIKSILDGQSDDQIKNILDSQSDDQIKNILDSQNADQIKSVLNIQNEDQIKNILDGQNAEQIQNILYDQNADQIKNILDDQNADQLKNAFNYQKTETKNEWSKIADVQNDETQRVPNKILSDTQLIQTLENFLDSEGVDKSKNINTKNNNIDNSLKQNENVININNLMNAQALHIISEKLGIVNNNSTVLNNKIMAVNNAQNENANLSDKLADIFSVVSPEIIKASAGESGIINNQRKFVIDLLSELNNDEERRDIFDFSESVVKVDPLQLAGLLDVISTGMGIPQAMDVSDNALFKNIDSANAAEKVSGKIIFDPKEMIETGEMEIVSYVPAESKAENKAQKDSQESNNFTENGEKTIDFARTMKSVKENVKPIVDDDETEKTVDVNPALTAEDMNNIAKKVDISFDRAYAELEMNKVKYGSADQQLFKGIAENLKRGRSEFTVKLRPEGLGEILVKLVSDDGGKTILSMIASSEKTAQLLNRDLASLQSSLNEHNVEIENNGVKTVENVNSSTTSFSQYDERRQDEANQQNQFRHLKSKLGNISVGKASFDNETEPTISNSVDSVLNITI